MAKSNKNNGKSIAFGVATTVAGVIASRSFDVIADYVKKLGAGKISPDEVAQLQIEIERLKTQAEEDEKMKECLRRQYECQAAYIDELNMENDSLSKKLFWCTAAAIALFIAMVVFIVI